MNKLFYYINNLCNKIINQFIHSPPLKPSWFKGRGMLEYMKSIKNSIQMY